MGKHKGKSNKNIAKEVKDGATSDEVERWLGKGRGSVTDTTKTGATALMLACQAGSRSIVKVLLENENGAVTAQDEFGNSALHHLTYKQKKFGKKVKILLDLLSTQGGQRMIRVPNSRGKTPIYGLYGLVSVARTSALGDADEVRRADSAQKVLTMLDPVSGGSLASAESNSNSAWQQKLGDAFEDDFQDYAGRENFTDLDQETKSFSAPSQFDPRMTEEQYRKSIVDGIQKKAAKRDAKDLIGPARPSTSEPDPEPPYEAKRRKLAEDMKRREQLQKQQEQRRSEIAKAEAEEKRKKQASANYERDATEFFDTKKRSARPPATNEQIPFPSNYGAISDVVLGAITEVDAKRKRILHELRRWHPDRWTGQMESLVAADDQENVLLRVIEISKLLNSLMPENK
eukprot:m.168618 g.168618  ORF g.168618 m.168618 type:complete len:402 (-) comp31530_c0_seq6:2092-3297(-)